MGPGGLFLKHRHTRLHARDRLPAKLFDRNNHKDWTVRGGLDTTARAAQQVDEILSKASSAELDDVTRRAVHEIVLRAERKSSRT